MTARKTAAFLLAFTMCFGATGCTRYYQITEPGSGNTYYTTNKDLNNRAGGAITFKDARTGKTVTLQSSEKKRISEGEYTAGIARQ